MSAAARSIVSFCSAAMLVLAYQSLSPTSLPAQVIPTPAGVSASRMDVASLPMPSVAPSLTTHIVAPQQTGCDGSRIRAASGRRTLGAVVALAGVAVSALAFNVTKTTDTQFGPVVEQSVSMPRLAVGLGALGVGGYMYYGGKADISAWDDALKSLQIGASTSKEVTACLGKPRSVSSSTSESGEASILTYRAKSGGVDQTYRLTFLKDVLRNIEKTATGN